MLYKYIGKSKYNVMRFNVGLASWLSIVCWISLSAFLPLLLAAQKLEESFAYITPAALPGVTNSVALGILIGILVTSIVGLCLSLLWSIRWPSKIRAPLFCILFLLTFAHYFVIVGGWYTLYLRGSMPHSDDLGLIQFLFDIRNLSIIVTSSDLTYGVVIILAIISGTTIHILLQPLNSSLRSLGGIVALILTLSVSTLAITTGKLGQAFDYEPMSVAANFTSPHTALVWGNRTAEARFTDPGLFSPPLTPSYSLEQYLANVQIEKLSKPNILMIVVEALRADAVDEQYQDQYPMPFLRSLSKEGVSFPQAYAAAPETEMSLRTIITGTAPLHYAVRDREARTAQRYARIFEIFTSLGYRTAYLTNEWGMTSDITRPATLDLYFDPVAPLSEAAASCITPQSQVGELLPMDSPAAQDNTKLEILRCWLKKTAESEKPFFGILFLYASHFPYESKSLPLVFKPTKSGPISFFSFPEENIAPARHRHLNALRYVDTTISSIPPLLRNAGLSETSLIITGDHGEMFGEHGIVTHAKEIWQQSIRVPLIFYGFKGLKSKFDRNSPVSHLDIAPSVINFLGLPAYGGFQGTSIVTTTESSNRPHKPVYTTVQSVSYEDSVTDWPYRLVINKRGKGRRLFNLATDPTELHNIYHTNPALSACLESLITTYRMRQISYYALSKEHSTRYFPPEISDFSCNN